MSPLMAAIFCLVGYVMLRLLHLSQPSSAPVLYVKDRSSEFVQSVLELCPRLSQPYVPTFLWGKSGHVQTVAYAKLGRHGLQVPSGVRHSQVIDDGSTVTFDMYEPTKPHATGGSYCTLIVPGIGNNSESHYIQMLVSHTLDSGYIAVVLNHLGSLKNQKLTSPRIFSYGGTEELGTVRREVERLCPGVHIMLVGLSMGGNIVVKYLGESKKNQEGILAAVSFCQGYDVQSAKELLTEWTNMRRCYVYVMTANHRRILNRHKDVLLSNAERRRIGVQEDQQEVMDTRLLFDLDEVFTRKSFGFDSLEEFYQSNSSSQCINEVNIPLLLVNTLDDPIVPEPLLRFPRKAAQLLPNCIFAELQHGGHLGFFEEGVVKPSSITWMDRLIVEYAGAITTLHHTGQLARLTGGKKVKAGVKVGEEDGSDLEELSAGDGSVCGSVCGSRSWDQSEASFDSGISVDVGPKMTKRGFKLEGVLRDNPLKTL